LERRRAGYEAVVDVPPALRPAVGRKRLRKGLGTRDIHVARARLGKALLELHARIAEACRACPATDPLRAEAFALRDEMEKARNGATVIHGYAEDGEDQPDALLRFVADRAGDIAEQHGGEAAGAFYGIASGTKTPLLHHLADWLHEGGEKGPYQPRTRRQLDRDIRELEGWLTGAKLAPVVEAIDRRTAARFVTEHLSRSGQDRKTIQRKVSACRSYWTWLGRKGIADDERNPWSRQAPPKVRSGAGEDGKERAFTDAELVTLLNGPADPELADLMRIAALSGMRIDEPYRLTVKDCAGGVFNIRRAKTRAGERRVPIHPDLAAIVARRTEGKDPSAFLFPEPGVVKEGRERSMAASKRFGHYRKRLGVAETAAGKRRSLVNFHSFRRWFVTVATRTGQPEHIGLSLRRFIGLPSA
jgi:integrase